MKFCKCALVRTTSEPLYEDWKYESREKFSKYGLFVKILLCTGININTNERRSIPQHLLTFIYPVLVHLTYVDYWVMSYANLKNKWHEYQVVISYLTSNTLSLLLWHIFYVRRRKVEVLLEKVEKMSKEILTYRPMEKFCINGFLIGVIFQPVFYSGVSVFLMNVNDKSHFHSFYTYGYEVKNFTMAVNAYLYAKTLVTLLLDPAFTGVVTALYCFICFRCYRLLSECDRSLRRAFLRGSAPPSGRQLLRVTKDFSRTLRLLEQLQRVFSFPSFMLVLVNSTSSFTTLASALLYSLEERTPVVTAENTFVFTNAAFLLSATIAFAAQIPITVHRIHECCRRLSENIAWNHRDCALEKSLAFPLKVIQERPVFVLSGCDIIYFKRSSILTALGAMFTYGLLVIQMR